MGWLMGPPDQAEEPTMIKLTITDIRNLPGVLSAKAWRDRVYVDIRGNGGRYAGEGNSKIWIGADGKLNIERGKGTTSREWDANLVAFRDAYGAAAV